VAPVTRLLLAPAFRLFVAEGLEHRKRGRFLAGLPGQWAEAGTPADHRAEARRLGHVAARIRARLGEAGR
jgi:hypothetical protein